MKQTLKPASGDTLLIGKYQSGTDRKGSPVTRSMPKEKEARTVVSAVYADARVRSKEGDVFEVVLQMPPTKTNRAAWITVL